MRTPASPRLQSSPLFWSAALLTAASATGWFSGTAIGERLGRDQLARVNAGLATLESLSQQIAITLHKQGVCLDAPASHSASQRDPETRIQILREESALQAPCVDLAIAQNQFETLQMETATLHLIEQKRSLTNGLVADSLNYRSRTHRRSEARRP